MSIRSNSKASKNKAVAADLLKFLNENAEYETKGLPEDALENFLQRMAMKHGYTLDDLEPILKTFRLEITRDFELKKIKNLELRDIV